MAVVPGPGDRRRVARTSNPRHGRAIGTDDPVVAASIFVQGYAYRIATLAVACLTVGGVLPGSEPGVMAVGLGRGRVSKVAYLEPTVFDLFEGHPPAEALGEASAADWALTLLLEQVVELHLRPLIGLTRNQVRIGERLLWGNVAASASTAFRTMEGCQGPWVAPLGERFFKLRHPSCKVSVRSSRSNRMTKGAGTGNGRTAASSIKSTAMQNVQTAASPQLRTGVRRTRRACQVDPNQGFMARAAPRARPKLHRGKPASGVPIDCRMCGRQARTCPSARDARFATVSRRRLDGLVSEMW